MGEVWYPYASSAGEIGMTGLLSVASAAESSSPGSMPSSAPAAAGAAGPASRKAVRAPSVACGGLDPRHHRNPQCSVWSMWRLQRLGLRTSRSPLHHQWLCSPVPSFEPSAAGPGSSVPSFSAIAGKNASAGSSSPAGLADTLLKALADAEWFEEPGFLMWDSEAEAVSKLTAGQCSHWRRRRCGAGPRRSVIGAWPSPLLQPPWQYCWISLASFAIVGRC